MKLRFGTRDLLYAWVVATVFSGLPSTLHALLTGADPLEATRAAGAMLVPAGSNTPTLVAAAAIVHPAVSLFWAAVFGWLLPTPACRTLGCRRVGSGCFVRSSCHRTPFLPLSGRTAVLAAVRGPPYVGRAVGRNAAGATETRRPDPALGVRADPKDSGRPLSTLSSRSTGEGHRRKPVHRNGCEFSTGVRRCAHTRRNDVIGGHPAAQLTGSPLECIVGRHVGATSAHPEVAVANTAGNLSSMTSSFR